MEPSSGGTSASMSACQQLLHQVPVLTQVLMPMLTARQLIPEEGDGYAAEDDGTPHARAVLCVARRADAEEGPPHVLLRLL